MDREDIIIDLNDHYSKKSLNILLEYMCIKTQDSQNKNELINLVIDGLYNKEHFNKLYNGISREASIVLDHLTWNGISTLGYIDSKYHIKISLEDFYGNTEDPFIKHFKQYYSKEILLSTGLRYLFKQHIPRPVILVDIQEGLILKGDNFVYDNLKAIECFIEVHNIKSRGLDKKLLIKSINDFKKEFNLYDDYVTLRANYILKFFVYLGPKDNQLESLKIFLNKYKNGTLTDGNIDQFIYYSGVKGCNSNTHLNLFLKRGRYTFINRIKNLESHNWTSITSLVRDLSLDEETQIFDTTYFGNLLSVKVEPDKARSYQNSIDLTFKSDNELYLLRPLLNGICTLLYSIGAADIMITDSEPTHFRLTELGRTLFGLPSKFIEPIKENFECSFNDKKLIITTKGKNSEKIIFLRRIGHSIGNGLFLINYKEFMKDCISTKDIEYNIKMLSGLLPTEMPVLWESFISSIYDRLNPIYNEQELIVVNFPQDNEDFIHIILEDDKIRNLFLMVEGFKGAFSLKNYKQFKKSMKDFGFFL